MLDVAPQKPLRADEPVTQNDELGPRGVTASNPAGAAGIETRGRCWCGLAAAAPASVSLHSVVGPRQSLPRAQSMLVLSRMDSFGFDGGFSGHRSGGQSNRVGSDRCRSETGEVKPQKKVSKVAVVVSAPVRRAAPQAGPKVRHVVPSVGRSTYRHFQL